MRKMIKIGMDFKDDGQQFYKGETRSVTLEKAGFYCGLGWASDCDGEIPTGELDLSPKTLEVHSAKNGVTNTDPPISKKSKS